jgi:hypothetical protein
MRESIGSGFKVEGDSAGAWSSLQSCNSLETRMRFDSAALRANESLATCLYLQLPSLDLVENHNFPWFLGIFLMFCTPSNESVKCTPTGNCSYTPLDADCGKDPLFSVSAAFHEGIIDPFAH